MESFHKLAAWLELRSLLLDAGPEMIQLRLQRRLAPLTDRELLAQPVDEILQTADAGFELYGFRGFRSRRADWACC